MFSYHHGGGGALGWTIFALQILALLGLGVLLASAFAGTRRRHDVAPAGIPASRAEPLEIIRRRYAQGEIDREQYLQATQDLGGGPVADAPPENAA